MQPANWNADGLAGSTDRIVRKSLSDPLLPAAIEEMRDKKKNLKKNKAHLWFVAREDICIRLRLSLAENPPVGCPNEARLVVRDLLLLHPAKVDAVVSIICEGDLTVMLTSHLDSKVISCPPFYKGSLLVL